MISYACKKYGKRQSRPDPQAGSLVFCDCGHAGRVPWASNPPAAAVPVPALAAAEAPALGQM